MTNSPLKNMIPLNSSNLIDEFSDVCEFVFVATKCSGFNKGGHSYLEKGVQEVLRCFGHKFRPSRISEKAITEFIKKWPKEKLSDSQFYKKWYPSRKKFYPLFLEHIIPQGSLIKRCQKCNSQKEVESVLSELEFVIILREENEMLKAKGYNSEGRETSQKAENVYKDCGIKLIPIL